MEFAANKPQFRVIEVAMTYRPEGSRCSQGHSSTYEDGNDGCSKCKTDAAHTTWTANDKFGSGAAEIEHHLTQMWKQDYDLVNFQTYDINQGNGYVPKVLALLTFQRNKEQWNGTEDD